MAKKVKLSFDEILEQMLVENKDKPYETPSNWVWTRLELIGDVRGGKRLPQGCTLLEEKTPYPYLRVVDFGDRTINVVNIQFLDESTHRKISNYSISNKDVYISIAGTIGKVGIIQNDLNGANLTENAAKITNLKHILKEYLCLVLCSSELQRQIIDSTTTTTQSKLALFRIGRFIIPLPPLSEQRRIVDLIESLFDKLDRAKELVKDVLDSFVNRKSAILGKAFTGELTAKWRNENGGDFERDWVEKELGNCGKWCGGGTPSKSNPIFWENGDLLWVSPKDMKSMYIEDTEDKITENAVDNSSAQLISNQAILFVVRSGILRRILPIAITMGPVTINQDMKALMPKEIEIKYLYWYCLYKESDIRDKCSKNGTTVESISSDLLYKYMVLLPPEAEQREIVKFLDTLLENEQKASDLCEVIDNIDQMKKSILARAFRGELSTNNPDEESALELLKEVLKEQVEG